MSSNPTGRRVLCRMLFLYVHLCRMWAGIVAYRCSKKSVCFSTLHWREDCAAQLSIAPVLEQCNHHKQTDGGQKETQTRTLQPRQAPTCKLHPPIHTHTLPHAVRAPALSHSSASYTGSLQRILLSSTEKKKNGRATFVVSVRPLTLSLSPNGEQLESVLPLSVRLSSSPTLFTFAHFQKQGEWTWLGLLFVFAYGFFFSKWCALICGGLQPIESDSS